MKSRSILIDIQVDKLTNSIENAITGDSFPTCILPLTKVDLKGIAKKNGWKFDWKGELLYPDRDVFKLTIVNNTEIIQGLISVSITADNVYIHLIENAPFNIGRNKVYLGVAGNLIAYACKLSFQNGKEGFVSFRAKTVLIKHYVEKIGAIHFGGHLLILDTKASLHLLNKYNP